MEMKTPPWSEELQRSQEMPCAFNSAMCGNDNYEQMLFIHCQSHLLCEWCQHHECTVEWRKTEGQREKRNQYYEIFQCYVLVFDYTNRIDQKTVLTFPLAMILNPKYTSVFTHTYNALSACRTIFPNQACNVHFVHTHYHIKYTLKGYAFDYAYAERWHQNWRLLWCMLSACLVFCSITALH